MAPLTPTLGAFRQVKTEIYPLLEDGVRRREGNVCSKKGDPITFLPGGMKARYFNRMERHMSCTCRNADPNSSMPAGGDGCVVNPAAAARELAIRVAEARELAIQAAELRQGLLAPAVLSTTATLMLTSTIGDRLQALMAPRDFDAELMPVANPAGKSYIQENTSSKENINGYL